MALIYDWHSVIASESHLSPDASRQLRDNGFVVLPGPIIPGGCDQLSRAYDRAVAAADPSDVHTSKNELRHVLTTSSIADRNSTAFTSIHRYCQLAVKSSAARSSSAVCVRELFMPAHLQKDFTRTSNIKLMDGH
jgi:hypothetical protein